MPIRFQDILPTARGKDDAFEELICQLGRRHPPDRAHEFRRIHGAGGDGGVEAYWVLAHQDEIGYQAKYYLSSSDVRWDAIEESVRTALSLHPRLVRYVVALACDLTDKTARGGKSGWEKWSERKQVWEAEARRTLGHDVVFELWPASRLKEMLEQPPMAGLLAHWFGTLPLTPEWLAERVQRAIADLGERYHAEDHVSVGSERLFDVLLRTDALRQRLHDRLQRVRAGTRHMFGMGQRSGDADNARSAVEAVLAVDRQIDAASWTPWAAAEWSGLAESACRRVSVLATNLRNEWHAQDGPARRYPQLMRVQQDGLAQLMDDLEKLGQFWTGLASQAERQRVVLLNGRGGSGKSHLLAHQAEAAAAERRPVVFVLGQQLGARAIWPQILERLGVEGSAERFLQALDSTAEAANKRALFIVDALNEGAGATARRHEIASFLATLGPYRNIVCVLSCRSEYLRYVVPATVCANIAQVEVRGFVTPEEQRAAALVYMDRKGIARPGTPWLAEEFTNPLFLRSVCVALSLEGRHEFPQGLVGTKKILSFYVGSVARHLVSSYEGSDDLAAPTVATLLSCAREMARTRRDYLPRREADVIAQQEFAAFTKPGNETWLEVLHRSGLFRFDPDPEVDPGSEAPMPQSIDVVRFSFQRFQDQLIADALLQGIDDVTEAFAPGGALHFLATAKQREVWGAGLIGALAIQLPERFERELVDLMPGGLDQWRTSEEMSSAFAGSIPLRAPEAFSPRTIELFETWLADGASSVSLLFQVATIASHPWNAEAMHDRLVQLSMPERDVRWTFALSGMGRRSNSHRFFSLCDWCKSPEAKTAPARTRELAALALAWCLTSSNRLVRDEATKALTHLMLAQAGMLPYLVERLKDVDDNYLSERLWAAAFGACSHDPTQPRLGSYTRLAWRVVFSGPAVPRNLLLRDYARAIVDLAVHGGTDLEGVDLVRCRPPYSDPAIALDDIADLDSEPGERLSAGAQSIVSSCSEYSDFGSYCIKPAVRDITTVRLEALPVASKESAFRRFWSSALAGREDRITAFRELEHHLRLMRMSQMAERDGLLVFKERIPSAAEFEQAEQLEARLLSLLTAEEIQVFVRDGAPWLENSFSPPAERVDAGKCRAWVARRAIEMGEAAVDVGNLLASRTDRPIVERLGKKYQWLALSELLCHLTSNLGLEVGDHEDRTIRQYDLPPDVGLVRDIDPTVLAYESVPALRPDDAWMFEPRIALDDVEEEELGAWPMRADPSKEFDRKVVRTSVDGERWFTLYDHVHVTDQYSDRSAEHGMRQQEFRRIFTVFVPSGRLNEFLAANEDEADLSVSDWEVQQLTDGPYLGEAVWRETWPQEQWSNRGIPEPRSVPQAFPLYDYRWESHLDLTLSEGARAYVPAAWLARSLGLKLSPDGREKLHDSGDRGVFVQKSFGQGNVVLLREDAMTHLTVNFGLMCVWLLVAERNAWPGGSNAMATRRRAEGIAWIKGGQVVCRTWIRDGFAAKVADESRTAPRKRGDK